ncbi:cystathionine gamma-lyase-like [Branchiostoma lanceolatum]|uniref:cystathionine gamma-lyase-like n=1 Tax=Branchiostoma lanceolatum TaxID=7740 RepID=UPI0034567B44
MSIAYLRLLCNRGTASKLPRNGKIYSSFSSFGGSSQNLSRVFRPRDPALTLTSSYVIGHTPSPSPDSGFATFSNMAANHNGCMDGDNAGFLPAFPHFATDAIHAGQDPEQWNSKAVIPPISLATTFKQKAPGQHSGFEYSRAGNPTRNCLEECFAALENGKHGLTFSSGLAATDTITKLLQAGDHIVSMDDVYGGTNRYFRRVASRNGIETSFVDCTDAANVAAALKPNTKMVWVETPTNPTLRVVDIQAVADVIKGRDIFLVSDNTFMSSYFQRPLDHGADIAFHSVTKYMNGHSDVVMGAVVTRRDDLHEKLRFLQYAVGAVPAPFDCFLVNRGLKTLAVRMKQHYQNGLAVAKFLESHPCVIQSFYPGLPSHPSYPVMQKQASGCSGMVTFRIKGGVESASKCLQYLKVFTLAESLGGIESLAEIPGLMTHMSVPKEDRDKLGIYDDLIRLSCGIEETADLIADLDQGLKKAVPEELRK